MLRVLLSYVLGRSQSEEKPVKLGFVTAVFPDLSLEDVVSFAASEGFNCLEVCCWPVGKADRRYAGVTHVDIANLSDDEARRIRDLLGEAGVEFSSLCYSPNALTPDAEASACYVEHIRKLIPAAAKLGGKVISSFIGRDPKKSVDENWPRFLEIWRPIVREAEGNGLKVAIENCPMFFTRDEWPGGKNLAHSPAVWRRMFEDIPNANFGLNFDPSHLIWQHVDYLAPLREFSDRIFHIHAKDVRLDREKLADVGILATPLEYHTPKLPGLGDVDWGQFFSVLGETGYNGAVCIEVEDRAYEESLGSRKGALRQSARFLRQCLRADF